MLLRYGLKVYDRVLKDGLKAAAKADLTSLTFFETGLFGWMALDGADGVRAQP